MKTSDERGIEKSREGQVLVDKKSVTLLVSDKTMYNYI